MASSSRPSAGGAQSMPSRADFNKLADDYRYMIDEAFTVFDTDKDGRLDYQEFRIALRALGFELEKSITYDYLVKYAIPPLSAPFGKDVSGSHCPPSWKEFTLPIFQALAGTLLFKRDPTSEVHRAFRLFDKDGKGIITVEDLGRVMREVNLDLDEGELDSMVREFDADGKGGVNLDEFERVMAARKQFDKTGG